jgi:hypothetical protein
MKYLYVVNKLLKVQVRPSVWLDIFINNGRDGLRNVFIKFTDGPELELACKQSDRIMIQNCIYRLQE